MTSPERPNWATMSPTDFTAGAEQVHQDALFVQPDPCGTLEIEVLDGQSTQSKREK
ncbi:hypothetical protein GCM10009612_14760 [Streptomyces beijiangensis]